MRVKDLLPNPKNPRKITDEKLKMLKASIENFGDLSGIVFNRKSGQLIGGHQRCKGFDPEAVIQITRTLKKANRQGTVEEGFITSDGETHKYRCVEFDEITEKAANLAANTHGGEWDDRLRADFYLDLETNNYPIEITGVTKEDIEDLCAPFRTMPEGLCDEDSIPETKETSIGLGDLFQLGQHRLLCGDSTDSAQVQRLMNGEKADMVFTDPPYNVGFKYNEYDDTKVSKDEWRSTCMKWHDEWKLIAPNIVLTPGCNNLEIWCQITTPTHIGCWIKSNANTTGRVTHLWKWEPIIFIGKFERKRASDVFEHHVDSGFLRDPTTGNHPRPKPVRLWEDIVENFSNKEDIVFEPFAGSGTTHISCEKTNRKCYGMEIDPQYCQVIIDRWEKFTGKKAEKIKPKTITRKTNFNEIKQ